MTLGGCTGVGGHSTVTLEGCTVWEVTALLLWGFTGMGGHSTMALGMYRWRKSQCCDPEGCAGIEVTASPLVLVF